MIYRRLGRTNLNISAIGLGGGVFNLKKDPTLTVEEVHQVVSYAIKNGVNIIDTGKEYDERFLSEAISKNRDKLNLITKSEAKDAVTIVRDINDSLKKLETGSIEIYQMHMVNSIEDLRQRIKNGVLDALVKAKSDGKIKFIGIFSHKIDVLVEAAKTNGFDVVTTVYNVGHTLAEDLIKYTKSHDIGFIAAAPLGNGVLVFPKYYNEAHRPGSEKMTVEGPLKFVLSNNGVSTVLVGSRNLEHIKQNLEVGKTEWALPENEREKIKREILDFLGENFCRGCRYCEPCEVYGSQLPISDILKLSILRDKYGLKSFATNQYLVKKRVYSMPECVECGRCEPKCPYGVQIVKGLKEASRAFGG